MNGGQAIELITEPQMAIRRRKYQFMVQTRYLSERQIYAEAFLRGLICGKSDESVSAEQKNTIDAQLKCDYEKWCCTGQDLTPVFMNHRATLDELNAAMEEVFAEIVRLEASGANICAVGAQIEFIINCVRRTNLNGVNSNDIQAIINKINKKYAEIYGSFTRTNISSQPTSTIYLTPLQTPGTSGFTSSINQTPINNNVFVRQQLQPSPPIQLQQHLNNASTPFNVGITQQQQQHMSPNNYRNVNDILPQTPNSMLNSRANASLIGPHKVNSTIISIISKNVYEPAMDAIDQIETWESQANALFVPIDYFLSYMEVLLCKELQVWWKIHRPRINSWVQFKSQFVEDFGDHNRAIKAEQAIANLSQGDSENFQQLFLRFTKLMSHVKPEKSEAEIIHFKNIFETRASCSMYVSHNNT